MCHTLDNVVNVKENCRYSGDSSVRSLARLFWGLLFVIFHNNICTYNYSELQHDVQYKYSDTIYHTGLWINLWLMWLGGKVIHNRLLCGAWWGLGIWLRSTSWWSDEQILEMGRQTEPDLLVYDLNLAFLIRNMHIMSAFAIVFTKCFRCFNRVLIYLCHAAMCWHINWSIHS